MNEPTHAHKVVIKWFREASPYINAHRNRTFVVYLSTEALESDNFATIIQDIQLLASLGIRLVVVHGASNQIDQHLAAAGLSTERVANNRVTSTNNLSKVQEVIGRLRADIEARLSRGLPHPNGQITYNLVTGGNFVSARPIGIVDGVDLEHAGQVRSINTTALNQQLSQGAIVLISPIGYAPSGECFNVNALDLASETAKSLLADKLILTHHAGGVFDGNEQLISEIQSDSLGEILEDIAADPQTVRLANSAADACIHGVERCHIVSFAQDGALLEELFTRDGIGTQIVRASYERIRPAIEDDVPGILDLIRPLEAKGILVTRSKELIESEVNCFTVIERDGMVVSCGALYPYGDAGELACLATHDHYRKNRRGELILKAIEKQAKATGFTRLFVLTTQSAHWFQERGFTEGSASDLPPERRDSYNPDRGSKLFFKSI